jgi:predicted nucleic acid-binding protein
MALRTECYVDTSAFIAFRDRSDSYHPLFRRLFADPPAILTSALVIAEGHAWFLRRYDQHRAVQFLAFINPKNEVRDDFRANDLRQQGDGIKRDGQTSPARDRRPVVG